MHNKSIFYYLLTDFKLVCMCVLVSVEGNTEDGQNWTGNAPPYTFMGTRQPIKLWEREEERETKDNACCMWFVCNKSIMTFQLPTTCKAFLIIALYHPCGFTICPCSSTCSWTTCFVANLTNILLTDSRVDHLHVTAACCSSKGQSSHPTSAQKVSSKTNLQDDNTGASWQETEGRLGRNCCLQWWILLQICHGWIWNQWKIPFDVLPRVKD